MSGTTPEARITLPDYGVRNGYTVRSAHWIMAPRLNNWIGGRGRVVIPAYAPLVTIGAGSDSEFHFRVRPSYQATKLRWSILLSAESEGVATIEIPSGTTLTPNWTVQNRRRAVPIIYDVDRYIQQDAEETLSIKISITGGSGALVESIGCEALPRSYLEQNALDCGSDRVKFWTRQPVGERNFYRELLQYQSVIKRSARRDGLHISWGSDDPWASSGAGPDDVFDGTFGLLSRFLYSGDTTRQMSWRVRARCSDGSTAGTVLLTNTGAGAASSAITIPAGSTAGSFFPNTAVDPETFYCNAEDTSTATGIRGGAVDAHTIKVSRTAGAGTIYLETIDIWEAPDAAPPAPSYRRITDAGEYRITDAGDYRITD